MVKKMPTWEVFFDNKSETVTAKSNRHAVALIQYKHGKNIKVKSVTYRP